MTARPESRSVALLFALLLGVAWMSVGAVVSTSLSVPDLTVTVLAAITTTLLALRYLLPARGAAPVREVDR